MRIFGGVMGGAILAVALSSIARADDVIALAPHVAVYDLKVQDPRRSSIRAVHGTLTYDFSGTERATGTRPADAVFAAGMCGLFLSR